LNDKREVTYEEGENYADEYDMDYFCESSAKIGYNTNEMFMKAARVLYNEYKKAENGKLYSSLSANSKNSFKLRQDRDLKEENSVDKSSCRC
jgi:hypothetical protein